jgi:TrmH family RNA methyltransferase
VLDGIQDPGNLGTILRTVDSVNLKQIVLSENTADPYNPKVVRSTMGAIFRLNIVESKNIVETLKNIKKNKYKVMATSLQTENTIYTVNYNKKAIVIGNEANGVSKEVMELADEKVKIPMLRKNRKPKCSSSNWNYFI